MNPHQLAQLPPDELCSFFCNALKDKDVESSRDCFAQIEFRFLSLSDTADGSREFLDQFLALSGRPEVRSLHLDDPLAGYVTRLEYLLELAGDLSRATTDDAVLLQIVDSRERGREVILALATAPAHGLATGDLAARLGISAANLSPLVSLLHAHGIVERSRQGKHVFNTLTRRGRALVAPPPREEQGFMFLPRPMNGLRVWVNAA